MATGSKQTMNELDFFCYSLYVQEELGYKPNWAFVIFRAYFGKWVTKPVRSEAESRLPTQQYLEWLDNYFQQNLNQITANNKS